MSADFLAGMAASQPRARATPRAARGPSRAAAAARSALPPPPPLRLSPQGFDLIAEVKLRSPAVGQLAGGERGCRRPACRATPARGAAAVSVLTEPTRFDGSMAHLEQAARALRRARVPAMRKDFLVDPYQVLEARAAGAGGVLVIAADAGARRSSRSCSTRRSRSSACSCCSRPSTRADIELAQRAASSRGARGVATRRLLVGVNCRDLRHAAGGARAVRGSSRRACRDGVPRVAESGVATRGGCRARGAACGYDLALVGSALMPAPRSAALAAELLSAAALGDRGRPRRGARADERMCDQDLRHDRAARP